MQLWWKNPRIVGTVGYWVISILKFTLRFRLQSNPKVDPNKSYLLAFWHGKQFMPAVYCAQVHNTPACALVSPSRDGAMLAVFLQKCGYEVVRGSSRDSGARALIQLKTLVDRGYSIGFAVDGPIGPLHQVKPGIIYLAQKLGVEIVVAGSAFSSSWVFHKAWDKFQLPKPFAKAGILFSDPIKISPDEDIDTACKRLEALLIKTEIAAQQLLT